MTVTRQTTRALLCSTALLLASATSSLAAFDPNAGTEAAPPLPDASVLYKGGSGVPNTPPPMAPLYPSHAIVAPVPPAASTASFPPVDPAVAAQAQQILNGGGSVPPAPAGYIAPVPALLAAPATEPPVVPTAEPTPAPALAASEPVAAPEPTGTIVPAAPAVASVAAPEPAPIIIPKTSVAAAPAVIAAPVIASADSGTIAPMEIVPPTAPLSDESKTILGRVPSSIGTTKLSKKSGPTKLTIDRVSPEVAEVLGTDKVKPGKEEDQTYSAVGLSIKVSRPGLDANYELNRAYTALMGGDTELAIQTYKNILSTEPANQDALFGLASTYHRAGNLDKARPLYGQLLKANPNHRDGLNNFLALLSDESPQEALAELARLEDRNPDFSPIPAQEAMVLDKLGYVEESRAKMLRAIELSPDNLSYKYNLAIMCDRNGQYADASALYRLLIDSSLKGAEVPASAEQLQKRLNYITSVAANEGHAAGS